MNTHDYESVLEAIRSKGFRATFVPISWDSTSMEDWLPQFQTEYDKLDPSKTVLAGFSYGAMIVLVAATKRQPSELWLMSLAPFFSEDLNFARLLWLFIRGRQRIKPFQKLSFDKLASRINCKTLVFIGDAEAKKYRSLEKRAAAAKKQIKDSELVRIPNGRHDITSPIYIQTLIKNI